MLDERQSNQTASLLSSLVFLPKTPWLICFTAYLGSDIFAGMPIYLAIFPKYFPFIPISSAHCTMNPSENEKEIKNKLTNYQLLWWLMHTLMLYYTFWNKMINLE